MDATAASASKLRPSEGERYNLTELFKLQPPALWAGTRLTPRRVQNLVQSKIDQLAGRSRVSAHPVKLTVEATNLCNLRCPACFTGVGEVGRPRGHMSLDLYRRLLSELAPYLIEIEFFNWGEPLLAPGLYEMVALAHAAGLSTTVSTNFSFRFSADQAERLVASGLTVLGVSIDGADQESYEKYRVGGKLERVLENCRLMVSAKQRLKAANPRLVWEFHVFPHNKHQIEHARALASEIGMEISVDKGWLIGPDWDNSGEFQFFLRAPAIPTRCDFLWRHAVVNHDGGVAPCAGTFYREDDLGRVENAPGDGGMQSFSEVWNAERMRKSRELFNDREGPNAQKSLICHGCERTRLFEEWRKYLGSRAAPGTFQPTVTLNVASWVNYLWQRRPPGSPEQRGLVPLRRKPET